MCLICVEFFSGCALVLTSSHLLQAIGDEIKLLKKKIKEARELVLLTELKQRIRVLKRLDFVSPDNVVTLKVPACLFLLLDCVYRK